MCDESSYESVSEKNLTVEQSKNVNKRRSSIFQRRSINHAPGSTADTCANASGSNTEQLQGVSEEEENFELNAYITSLKNEREEWEKVLKERKSQRRRLAKQELNIGDECELDLSVLDESDRAFLAARPNYRQIHQNINNLVPMAVKTAVLSSHIEHLNEKLTETMEEKIKESTKQINTLIKK